MWRSGESGPDVAGLAHDLNNVFETIAEAAELLTGHDCAQDLAGTIARSVERGRRLVAGFADQHFAAVDLSEVVERAASFVRDLTALMGLPEVRVVRNFEPGLKLKGLASEWERVFMNLFLNAAQAMAEGGEITVRLHERPDGCEIEVADQGPGIPAGILDRIFQPNFSTRQAHPGLGLHIVETIVKRQGGEVRAANRAGGRGAEFRITLPAQA